MAITVDPDILSNLIILFNLTTINGIFLTFTGMHALVNAQPLSTFKVLKATMDEFPTLIGQSVSYATL